MDRIQYSGLTIYKKSKQLRDDLNELSHMIESAEIAYGKSGITHLILKREYDAKFKELRELESTLFVTEG